MRLFSVLLIAATIGLAGMPAHAQGTGPEAMQQRFERMQEMRQQMRQQRPREGRREMRRDHRRLMHEQMAEMQGMERPGPEASIEERMQFMEQRHQMMMQMMQEMLDAEDAEVED